MRFPRLRSARLAADLAEGRDRCATAEDLEAALDRIDTAFAMIAVAGERTGMDPRFCGVAWEQAGREPAGLPRTRAALFLVRSDDRPGAA